MYVDILLGDFVCEIKGRIYFIIYAISSTLNIINPGMVIREYNYFRIFQTFPSCSG